MSEDFYQQHDQSIYIVDEEVYGEYYDPEAEHVAWTAITGTFPHVMPVNVITDSFDYEIPRILKEKLKSIGSGKYASLIVNTVQEPVEISFETKMQHPVFLAYATGAVVSTGTRAEISTVTPVLKSSCVQDSYFLLNDLIATGEKHYAIWIDVSGSGVKPVIAGINATNVIQVDLNLDTDAQSVSDRIVIAINTTTSITADNAGGTVVPITCTNDNAGAVRDIRDSGTVATGFTFAMTTQGVNTHIVTENTGYNLPSFTFHVEQRGGYSPILKSSSDDGYTVVSSKSFKDDDATFQTDTVAVGNMLCIDEGTHIGKYLITSIVSETEITVANPNNFISSTALDYRILDTEDIIIDLFGCVITDYELTVDYGDKIVRESVTLKTVNFAIGDRLTNTPSKVELINPHTWADLKGATNYLLREGVTNKTPNIVKKSVLKITNDVEFQPELESRFPQTPINGSREISLQLVGHTKNRDTFDYYKDTWDNVNQRYTSASGKLNTLFKLERDATYDYFLLSVYNWLIEEHNHHVFAIDDRIKSVDLKMTEATPDSNLRMIDSFSIVDYLSDTCYHNSFS